MIEPPPADSFLRIEQTPGRTVISWELWINPEISLRDKATFFAVWLLLWATIGFAIFAPVPGIVAAGGLKFEDVFRCLMAIPWCIGGIYAVIQIRHMLRPATMRDWLIFESGMMTYRSSWHPVKFRYAGEYYTRHPGFSVPLSRINVFKRIEIKDGRPGILIQTGRRKVRFEPKLNDEAIDWLVRQVEAWRMAN